MREIRRQKQGVISGGLNRMGMSSGQVVKELKITIVTLYQWIKDGKIACKVRTIGKKNYYDFDPKEVARIKALFKKTPEPGRSLLREE